MMNKGEAAQMAIERLEAENAKLRVEVDRLTDSVVGLNTEIDRLRDYPERERLALLQNSELKDKIVAESMRAKMLDTVHQVALRQNTAMLELADHYTGTLWPEEVQRAAKEILLAAQMAKNDKPKCDCGTSDESFHSQTCRRWK